MLKSLSLIGYIGMVGALVGLLAMWKLFSTSPLVIAIQVAAFLLFLWARVTFGRRSFHLVANPTEGGLVTKRAISVHPASNLRSDVPVHLGGSGGELVVEQRVVWWG
jgi:hypothetical protein